MATCCCPAGYEPAATAQGAKAVPPTRFSDSVNDHVDPLATGQCDHLLGNLICVVVDTEICPETAGPLEFFVTRGRYDCLGTYHFCHLQAGRSNTAADANYQNSLG